MREYQFKRGFKPNEERLEEAIKKYFGDFRREGDTYIVSYGAIEELKLKIQSKKLIVESKTNPAVSNDVATDTLKTYNRFLEELTGYTARERQKRLKKSIEKE